MSPGDKKFGDEKGEKTPFEKKDEIKEIGEISGKKPARTASGDSFDIIGDTTLYDADFGPSERDVVPAKTISDKGYLVVTQKDQKEKGVSLTEDEIKSALEQMAQRNRQPAGKIVTSADEGHSGGVGKIQGTPAGGGA
jgi:hypothetical protein